MLSSSRHQTRGDSRTPPRSRGAYRVRVFQNESPSKREEGAGNAGREPHPQPRVQNERAHEHSHHRFSRNIPAFPAQWFYGFLRALPGDLALLPPSSARCKSIVANLTPALACQDHTTSPSASASLVWRHQYVHRIPRPTLVTIAKRPFSGRGTRRNATDLGQPAMAHGCGRLARRANRASRPCVFCPSCKLRLHWRCDLWPPLICRSVHRYSLHRQCWWPFTLK